MSKYLMRLDDASDYMDVEKWNRMENLLDSYHVKPLVGVIPDNQDPSLVQIYPKDMKFWDKVRSWQQKGWELALHGCNHKYITEDGGLNPINLRSEFAGVPLQEQCEKIQHGIKILNKHQIYPRIFFAPSHTFDENTLLALKQESDIRIISDTIANDIYYQDEFFFLPQQSGHVRNLPFQFVTFCYHPNMMDDTAFSLLEKFLQAKANYFISIKDVNLSKRSLSFYDKFLRKLYFLRR
jgi:predicted deacetylase